MDVGGEIVIIGGGPAGIEAALTATCFAEQVVHITAGKVGDWKLVQTSR